MNEETIQFPLNKPEDIEGIIKSHLRDAGITAHIGISNNNFSITPDKKVKVVRNIAPYRLFDSPSAKLFQQISPLNTKMTPQ